MVGFIRPVLQPNPCVYCIEDAGERRETEVRVCWMQLLAKRAAVLGLLVLVLVLVWIAGWFPAFDLRRPIVGSGVCDLRYRRHYSRCRPRSQPPYVMTTSPALHCVEFGHAVFVSVGSGVFPSEGG